MAENNLKIEATYGNLKLAAKFAGEWAQEAELDERATYALQMAVDEACGNIIAHAYGGDGNGDILLTGRIIDNKLEINLTDFGVDFSATDEGQTGRFLMRQLTDKLSFVAEDTQNTLTMHKARQASE